MNELLKNFLERVVPGTVQRWQNMYVVDLYIEEETEDYMLSSEAFERGILKVEEKSESGSVPEIRVKNRGNKPVLILAGEKLIGAKQNRVVNVPIWVPANTTILIPVSCMEKGRWGFKRRDFEAGKGFVPQQLLRTMNRRVRKNVEKFKRLQADQGEVWKMVDRYGSVHGVYNSTADLHDMMQKTEQKYRDYLKAFKHLKRQTGLMVFIDGEIAGADILTNHEKFGALFDEYIKSYASEAYLSLIKKGKRHSWSVFSESNIPDETILQTARSFLNDAKKARVQITESPGKGYDYRFASERTEGLALVVDEKVIYMSLYPNDNRGSDEEDEYGFFSRDPFRFLNVNRARRTRSDSDIREGLFGRISKKKV